ncbi:MAG: hypothetical protein AAGK32_22255 [Actinomycetota bacterium]
MHRHRPSLIRVLALLAGPALLLTACASRPSADRLAEAILVSTATSATSQVTADEALCIANALLATDLSDTTLSGLADDFANPTVLETEANDVGPAITAAAQACR